MSEHLDTLVAELYAADAVHAEAYAKGTPSTHDENLRCLTLRVRHRDEMPAQMRVEDAERAILDYLRARRPIK